MATLRRNWFGWTSVVIFRTVFLNYIIRKCSLSNYYLRTGVIGALLSRKIRSEWICGRECYRVFTVGTVLPLSHFGADLVTRVTILIGKKFCWARSTRVERGAVIFLPYGRFRRDPRHASCLRSQRFACSRTGRAMWVVRTLDIFQTVLCYVLVWKGQ